MRSMNRLLPSSGLLVLGRFEQHVSLGCWHPLTKQDRVTVILLLLALWTSNVTHFSLLLVVVHWPVQVWGAETCATKYLSVKISYKNQCHTIFKWLFGWQKQKWLLCYKLRLLQPWLMTLWYSGPYNPPKLISHFAFPVLSESKCSK